VIPNQVLCLDTAPNRLMPDVFREVDLAVFPNRCEAGTNLVAMEALAFGLPCLISQNTGHLDIIQNNNAIPLTVQKPIEGLVDFSKYRALGHYSKQQRDSLDSAKAD